MLFNIYNIQWQKGYHSIQWKTPISIRINKPNKPKSNPSNYRPIVLINNLSNILESIIKNKLTKFAEDNNLMNEKQAGFRSNKSTQDQLFKLTQITTQAKN